MTEQNTEIILAKDVPTELRGQVVVHLPRKDPKARRELRIDSKKENGHLVVFDQEGKLSSLGPKSKVEVNHSNNTNGSFKL